MFAGLGGDEFYFGEVGFVAGEQSWVFGLSVGTGRHDDNARARGVRAGIRAGEIVIFDCAHVTFAPRFELGVRGVSWVTRSKESLEFCVG